MFPFHSRGSFLIYWEFIQLRAWDLAQCALEMLYRGIALIITEMQPPLLGNVAVIQLLTALPHNHLRQQDRK